MYLRSGLEVHSLSAVSVGEKRWEGDVRKRELMMGPSQLIVLASAFILVQLWSSWRAGGSRGV